MDNFGVVYILAAGCPVAPKWENQPYHWDVYDFAASVYCSANSLRLSGYDGEILLLCDVFAADKVNLASIMRLGITVKIIDNDMTLPTLNGMQGSRSIKTRMIEYIPKEWNRFLYFDSDVIPFYDPTKRGLADFPFGGKEYMAMADDIETVFSMSHGTPAERDFTLQLGRDCQQLNTGVMLVRVAPASHEFFDLWHKYWREFADVDQLALLRAYSNVNMAFPENYAFCFEIARLSRRYNLLGVRDFHEAVKFGAINWHCAGFGGAKKVFERFYPEFENIAAKMKESYK